LLLTFQSPRVSVGNYVGGYGDVWMKRQAMADCSVENLGWMDEYVERQQGGWIVSSTV
jgi:hypothetical protein